MTSLATNRCYTANPETKKKVVAQGQGWMDESANKYMDTCQRRYISNLKFVDETGQIFMTVFDEDCAKLVGMSADELYELEGKQDQSEFKVIIASLHASHRCIRIWHSFSLPCALVLPLSHPHSLLMHTTSDTIFLPYQDVWNKTLFSQHIVKVRAKSERWEEKDRVKCTIVSMAPVKYADENKALLERIRAYKL